MKHTKKYASKLYNFLKLQSFRKYQLLSGGILSKAQITYLNVWIFTITRINLQYENTAKIILQYNLKC